MDKFSHCAIHDTFPQNGDPCWSCVNQFGDRKLQAENKKLKEEINSLRHATGMLNSMVLGREQHSPTSRKVVKDAMTGKKTECQPIG